MFNQEIKINGQVFYSHPCKFQEICDKNNRYNPALTTKNKYGVEHLNQCTVGGGCGCKHWREETDKEIGWNNPLNRHLYRGNKEREKE
jgi:hypothetical protein